ncbi:IS3 family transposase [Labrys portucalensis]|uniref:IS3 family transposase n=1 Tax=Labrys neptuniae TaxID=376174 RepID=A0ABV6ZSM4_9HYPH
MIDLPRSSFYYRATPRTTKLSDTELVTLIEDIQDELPCYGYRRVTHELCRRGHLVNHKRVARVMRAAGLGIKPRRRYARTTDSNHDSPIYPNLYRNLIPDRPDIVWVADFTYCLPSTIRRALSGWASRLSERGLPVRSSFPQTPQPR